MALTRLGIPQDFVDMVAAILRDRRFYVRDWGHESAWKQQTFGIVQGCPLSPFLFIIVMTVLLHDARGRLERTSYMAPEKIPSELVYADDTLTLGVDEANAQLHMEAIAAAGKQYGLEYNWAKLEVLPINTSGMIETPGGDTVTIKESITYLGSALSNDGRICTEVSRRLGAAKCTFGCLQRVWNNSTLGTQRKIQVLTACVYTKLLYGLTVVCLTKADKKRIDGFQARCLRRILRIPPVYYSRISNTTVLERARQKPLSQSLVNYQLLYFGQLARRPDSDPVRSCIFEHGSAKLKPLSGTRRVGRPRFHWGREMMKESLSRIGDEAKLQHLLSRSSEREWCTFVKT